MSVNYCIYAVKMLRKNRNGHCVAAVSNAYGGRQQRVRRPPNDDLITIKQQDNKR